MNRSLMRQLCCPQIRLRTLCVYANSLRFCEHFTFARFHVTPHESFQISHFVIDTLDVTRTEEPRFKGFFCQT
jgi:hypothetical protein